MDNTRVVWVFKPIGWNPSDCVAYVRKHLSIEDKIAFAGRLDPMACGLLPLIVSNNGKEIQDVCSQYQSCYKTYQFSMVCGVQSDSCDIMGMVESREFDNFESNLSKERQAKKQTYPIYSSKTVYSSVHNKQVPLWKLAKEGNLPAELPERDIDIEYIKVLSTEVVTGSELLEIVNKRLDSMINKKGFRLEDISDCWKTLVQDTFTIHHMEAKVSTGTYIRTIVDNLGGVAYDICRVHMNDMRLKEEYDKFVISIL